MIQRIQSLFLLGVALLMVLTLLFPFWSYHTSVESLEVDAFNIHHTVLSTGSEAPKSTTTNNIYVAALIVLIAAVSVFELFQFKNRSLQLKLGMGNTLLIAGLVFLYSLKLIPEAEKIVAVTGGQHYEEGFFMPLIAFAFNYLANRFIRKDDALIKSVDRIR